MARGLIKTTILAPIGESGRILRASGEITSRISPTGFRVPAIFKRSREVPYEGQSVGTEVRVGGNAAERGVSRRQIRRCADHSRRYTGGSASGLDDQLGHGAARTIVRRDAGARRRDRRQNSRQGRRSGAGNSDVGEVERTAARAGTRKSSPDAGGRAIGTHQRSGA